MERRSNPVLQYPDADAFVEGQLGGLQPYPSYYAHMGPINLMGPEPLPDMGLPELDAAGLPVARLHVFAYRSPEMTGTPDFFSAPSGPDGRFALELPGGGPYYLLARQEFGGPAREHELHGRHGGATPLPVHIDPRGTAPEVTIHVAPKP